MSIESKEKSPAAMPPSHSESNVPSPAEADKNPSASDASETEAKSELESQQPESPAVGSDGDQPVAQSSSTSELNDQADEGRRTDIPHHAPESAKRADVPLAESEPQDKAPQDKAPQDKAAAGAGLRIKIGSLGDPAAAKQAKPKGAAPEPGLDVKPAAEVVPETKKFPPPNLKRELPPDLEKEVEEALGGMSLDQMLAGQSTGPAAGEELEPETKVRGRIVSVHRDDIFVDLGGERQGVVSLRQFDEPPAPGNELELMVSRFNGEDGLYELSLPGAAVEVGDWSQIEEGIVVQATVTGHNKGGLECSVSNIRAFMPYSQVSLYRVEDLEQFVGESWPCLVTEAKPERKNLVLSRRAVLEREQAEARQKLIDELEIGQIREGIVRSLQNFGAFVDLGGVDGLIHVSQLSWDRVGHPREVLHEGQTVRVRIAKYDKESGKIGLAYRDLAENPWDRVPEKYAIGSTISGTVSKLMDFGAFVKLEPGVEGLIHVSELAHGRVWRPSDVLSEGQEVDVKVLSIDTEKQRIGLSLKALMAKPTPTDKEKAKEEAAIAEIEAQSAPVKKHQGNLKGGLGSPSGGEQFGLKW